MMIYIDGFNFSDSLQCLVSFFIKLLSELMLVPSPVDVEQFGSIFYKTDTGDAPREVSSGWASLLSSKIENHGNLPCLT
jgi:hypothetical protein